ncbi:MAG: hypothetical protein ACAH95_12300 [Fimbriimonas sp.]
MIRSVCLFLLLACASASYAATARAEGGTLFVNEVRVLTLRATVGKAGPKARAAALARHLDKRTEIDLSIQTTRQSAKIYESGEVLILINKAEASSHDETPASLASAWIANLRAAWVLPPIKLSNSSVTLPLKGVKTIDIVGRAARTAPMFIDTKDVAKVTRLGATLTIKPVGLGESTLTIGEGNEAREIRIRVLPYAAPFPQTYGATVVGAPASASSMKSVVEGVLKTRLQGVQGVEWDWTSVDPSALSTGQKTTLPIRVKASSPNAFPSEGIVNVVVTNLGLALKRETELWYCNDPENVKKPQSLFMARLQPNTPVRMLYHHINDSYQGLLLRVFMSNNSDKPAQVVIIPGDSKDKNPVLAGVLAADPFFRSWVYGSGEVVTIPPGGNLPIAFRRLAPQETSSGLCYLRLLPGGPENLTVTTEAVVPYDLDAKWQAALRTPTPWREVGAPSDVSPAYPSEHSVVIYPSPFKDEQFTYNAGGNYSFFRIGQRPIARQDKGQALDGNFGVIYNIQAKALNNTGSAADIELVFETSAGYSGGIFLLDGQFIRLPLMQAKAEARLARFRLEPGGSKTINVSTIPLSGSSYPATLVLRPVSTLPDLPGK